MNIKGSHILVTGGSLGIGRETAKQLVDQGARVVITGRNETRLNEAAKATGATPLVFDISDLNSIPAKATEILDLLDGRLDVLVNNAGIGGNFATLGEVTAEDFDCVFRTNVFGLTLLTQELLPALKTAKTAKTATVINVGSTASLKGFARGTVYAASKFALRGISQSWQAELRRENIRVCHINPSEVTTAFGSSDRNERADTDKKLDSGDIAHTILSVITMDDKGFIPEVTVWATNPF